MSKKPAKSFQLEPLANKAQAAEWFGLSLPGFDGWIRRGCPVVQRGGPGKQWTFDLRALTQWRLSSGRDDAAEQNPEDMTPKDRLDHYRAVRERMKAEAEAGELCVAAEVERVTAEMVKQFVLTLDTLADVLERDAGLPPAAVARTIEVVDAARDDLYGRLTGE